MSERRATFRSQSSARNNDNSKQWKLDANAGNDRRAVKIRKLVRWMCLSHITSHKEKGGKSTHTASPSCRADKAYISFLSRGEKWEKKKTKKMHHKKGKNSPQAQKSEEIGEKQNYFEKNYIARKHPTGRFFFPGSKTHYFLNSQFSFFFCSDKSPSSYEELTIITYLSQIHHNGKVHWEPLPVHSADGS